MARHLWEPFQLTYHFAYSNLSLSRGCLVVDSVEQTFSSSFLSNLEILFHCEQTDHTAHGHTEIHAHSMHLSVMIRGSCSDKVTMVWHNEVSTSLNICQRPMALFAPHILWRTWLTDAPSSLFQLDHHNMRRESWGPCKQVSFCSGWLAKTSQNAPPNSKKLYCQLRSEPLKFSV